MNKLPATIKSNTAITCTGCRYCEGDCPQNIATTNYFAQYNEGKRSTVEYDARKWTRASLRLNTRRCTARATRRVQHERHIHTVNYVRASGFYYMALSQTRGKATDCIECGLYEKNCPRIYPFASISRRSRKCSRRNNRRFQI